MKSVKGHISTNTFKENKLFIVCSLFVLLFIYALQNINERFWLNDFRVYFMAAENLLQNKNVYGEVFGQDTGLYKYSPFILLFFAPLTLFSYFLAGTIHYIAICLATFFSILLIRRIILKNILSAYGNFSKYIVLVSFICVLDHLFRELHLGNVNMIIVFLLSLAIYLIFNHHEYRGGAILGLVVLIKPYLLLLSLPVFLHKKYKTIFSQIFTLFFSFIIMMLFFGMQKTWLLHTEWLKAMLYHSTVLTSPHTLTALMRQYVFAGMLDAYQYYLLVIVAIFYALLFFFYLKPRLQRRKTNASRYLFLGVFSLLALIPNILITDTEHFLFSLPLILYAFFQFKWIRSIFLKSLFATLILIYGTCSSDIYGSALHLQLENAGVLGMVNLCLIVYIWIVLSKDPAKNLFLVKPHSQHHE